MAETTVQKLAELVGTPVDTLLTQMRDAGLPHKAADEGVSDEQKQQLLAHLRKSHGGAEAEPKKITLTRKTTTTIKTTGTSGKAKTVAVEVRKKRTYVKREVLEAEEREREEQERLEAERIAAEEAARKAAEEARRQAEEEAAKWNTGVVVEREGDIRSFDKSEKSRSKLRAYMNKEQW